MRNYGTIQNIITTKQQSKGIIITFVTINYKKHYKWYQQHQNLLPK